MSNNDVQLRLTGTAAKFTAAMIREARSMFPDVSIRDIREALADTGDVARVGEWITRGHLPPPQR